MQIAGMIFQTRSGA
ncbi:hypothetical protein RO865_18540 [Blautia faecis]|nr:MULTISPECIES: DUF6783 domain-containing protein [Blautia]MDT4370767.1 hypothetical protein [Blautia faecis]MED9823745.1 DUF6783 domain-containing protein [Blautia faecis]